MPRLDRLPQVLRNTLLTFPAQVNDTTPFAPLKSAAVPVPGGDRDHRRLASARATSRSAPATRRTASFPSGTPAPDILQSQTSIGFDRVPIMRDVNISFPIDRLRELAARGEIGGLAPNCYSFLGAQRDFRRIEAETAPETARRLRDEGVDVALITPT